MIQHVPGGVVCFNEKQIDMFHHQFIREPTSPSNEISCLYVNCFKKASFVTTTMNTQKLYFFEMCIEHMVVPDTTSTTTTTNKKSLIPLSCFFTTNTDVHLSLNQWLSAFFNAEKGYQLPIPESEVQEKPLAELKKPPWEDKNNETRGESSRVRPN